MEKIFEVFWDGPFSTEHIEKTPEIPNRILYAVYSTHPLYGKQSLVYIGRTEQALPSRVRQHAHWMLLEADPIVIYTATVGPFTTWEAAEKTVEYPPMQNDDIAAVEALLILAHQPAYNTSSKISAESARHYRVFNSGRFGSLLPEVSGLYYVGDRLQNGDRKVVKE